MYRRFQDRFGTAGVIIAVIALVAALSGTALAAKGALTGKQKKEVEKIAKKYAGKAGAPGSAGANGTNGTNGKDGAEGKEGPQGKAGEDGTDGTNGTNGAAGKGVEKSTIPPGPTDTACDEQGGAIYEVEGSGEEVTICDGKEGSPWTAGGTLPAGAVETGSWAFTRPVEKINVDVGGVEEEITIGDSISITVPISFAVPLGAGLNSAHVHFEGEAGFSTFCDGTASSPTALNSGELCVYRSPEILAGTTFEGICRPSASLETCPENTSALGASKSGAVLLFSKPTGDARGSGTFAVRG